MAVLNSVGEAVSLRPARLNFAGWCNYCGEQWCEDASCVALHAESLWVECDDCHGTQRIEGQIGLCGWCLGGLTQVTPAGYRAAQAARESRLSLRRPKRSSGVRELRGWGI